MSAFLNESSDSAASTADPRRTREAVDWASANGLMVRSSSTPLFDHAPFTLHPTPYPSALYARALELAAPFGLLVDRCARDSEWLRKTLAAAAEADPFVAKQMEVFEAVESDGGPTQHAFLGIHRSDYMLHQPDGASAPEGLLQVELNTIAASFGCLSTQVSRMHRYLARLEGSEKKTTVSIPGHDTTRNLAAGIAAAHAHYVDSTAASRDAAVASAAPLAVLFVVQDGETNSVDQRMLEYAVVDAINGTNNMGGQKLNNVGDEKQDPATVVRVIRRSLTALADKSVCKDAAMLSKGGRKAAESPRRSLIVDGHEISVVYFRAGYTPRDYPSQAEWDARLFVERTHAIKCPSIAYQLVGAKKAQQQLAVEGEVERFLSVDEGLAKVRQSFAGLYEVDDASVAMVLARGGKGFVMKPQREGGGNNIYEGDIPAALASMKDAAERRAYIFMSMIRPPALSSVLVRSGKASSLQPTLSELGIYSTFLGDGASIFRNEFAGHLLRTKPLEATEGGVASGYSVLDSPELV